MRVVFDHFEAEGPGIVTFWFRPEQRVRFEPGQFAEFRVPHAGVDARGDAREFSLSSSPNEPLIALTTNFAAENGSSFKRALRNLKRGDEITMAEPLGDFVLPKDPSIPLVFIAAGVGCAPFAGMVKWLAWRGEQRTIQLIYSARRPSDFIFTNLWYNYPLDFIPIVTQPNTGWHGRTGRLSAPKVLNLIGPVRDKLIYLAGPQTMIEPLFNNLLAAGLPRSQLLLDYFTGY